MSLLMVECFTALQIFCPAGHPVRLGEVAHAAVAVREVLEDTAARRVSECGERAVQQSGRTLNLRD